MPFVSLLKPVAVAALCVAAGASQATMTVYTSQAAFLSAISSPGVDSFDDLDYTRPLTGPLGRTAGAYSYTASTTTALFYGATDTGSDIWLGTNTRTDTVTLAGFSAGVQAAGGYFFGTDSLGYSTTAAFITVTGSDASGSSVQTIVSPTQSSFLGFVSTGAMTALTFTVGDQGGNGGVWPTLNNLTLGTVAAVPEPETYALMLGGLAMVGWLARRRSAAA